MSTYLSTVGETPVSSTVSPMVSVLDSQSEGLSLIAPPGETTLPGDSFFLLSSVPGFTVGRLTAHACHHDKPGFGLEGSFVH